MNSPGKSWIQANHKNMKTEPDHPDEGTLSRYKTSYVIIMSIAAIR